MDRGHNFLDNKSYTMSALLALMISLGINPSMDFYKRDNTDDKVINPPQSEKTKSLMIKKAEQKRLRKNNSRKGL
jgi:hypothetical protein